MSGFGQLQWLVRRVSRIGPAEVPFRVHGVLRSLWQSRGLGDASKVPARAADARFGAPWVAAQGVPAGIDRAAVLARADALVGGRLEIFNRVVDFGAGSPAWNTDPVTGTPIELRFGLFIDFRHLGADVDIKYLWEINRLGWWVAVAQAWACSGELRHLDALARWLRSWLDGNPYPLGANWASPVEHGIRLINWSLVWHLVGGHDSPMFFGAEGTRLREDWLDAIYRHIRFAADNYSLHSSSDNHLIGELAGVYVGARTWDLWASARELGARAKQLLEREAQLQFAPDGINREQAPCYQKFSLQFLLASGLAARATGEDFSAAYWQRIEASIVSLAALMDCRGAVPSIGDADDAAVFELAHGERADPYRSLLGLGARLFGRAELAAKLAALPATADVDDVAWLLGPAPEARAVPAAALAQLPQRFADGGYLVAGDRLHQADETRLVFDCGPLGYNRIGGHAHADALSLLLSVGGVPLLVDAGTYCYNAAPQWRRFFRGTSAHNTLELDGTEQSIYGGSFLWLRDYHSQLEAFDDDGRVVSFQAVSDGYRRVKGAARHRRRVVFDRAARRVVVTDTIESGGPHAAALHWHFAPECELRAAGEGFEAGAPGASMRIQVRAPGFEHALLRAQESPPQGWVSRRFYQKAPAWVLRSAGMLAPGQALVTTMHLDAQARRGQAQ